MSTPDLSEISREIPPEIAERYRREGIEPLLIAYGCVMLEHDTGINYVYTGVNLTTGRVTNLSRRTNPITTKSVVALVEKMRKSSISGRGRWEADRHSHERIAYDELYRIQEAIFREVLPEYGYAVRERQIELAEHIMDTIRRRNITLAESEVGTGKTHAYLIAAILVKRGRANDFWNTGYYPAMKYVDMAYMPVVISTSSIALQKAIVRDYIPEISKILMRRGIIKTPLTAVIRKGKEHYLCERNLLAHIPFEHDKKVKRILEYLLEPSANIDLAETDGMTKHVKRKICVEKCHSSCPQRLSCRYLQFLNQAQSPKTDIQVCNHNYILADTKRRSDGLKPLIPNYQILVIDEGHKFLQAARQMYGVEFSSLILPELVEDIKDVFYRMDLEQRTIRLLAKKLSEQNTRLFRCINNGIEPDESEDDAERYHALQNAETSRRLWKIRDIADSLILAITSEKADNSGGRSRILRELDKVTETAAKLAEYDGLICWLEKPDGIESFKPGTEMKLCAIPNDLDKRLYKELWSKGFPVILTSGTLSSGAGASGKRDFTHIKRTLGLEYAGIRLTETSKPSTFNYRDNALLYISEDMPFPDNKNPDYINAVADEVEKLIRASHGHAAVLFTSHDALGRVHSILKRRNLPYPLFRLERSDIKTIDKFKQSGNGVLFASGSMWEGVDIPGDALSMLIIIKLPFAVPDPVSEYERTLYPNFLSYKNRFIVPDMLIKLRQGFGRLLRLERDTGIVAILDSRVSDNGIYRSRVLAALPPCVLTSYIEDVVDFLRAVKSPEYFL